MANYSINPAAAHAVVDELVAVTRRLDASLATLQASVVQFTQANNGNAPAAYTSAQQSWNNGQGQMKVALARGNQTLQEIIQQYQRGDQRGAGIFGG
ncbi:hypothetical protein [Micromonospora sp. RTGN7]|uniref:WXG100 family type VII secretion target n=1 Tax=Micromonospora sp. RTGN7 TaxID=3016526 RepID=UPI0029FED0A6|nr:hypothetical protein [Micromonospora sp. RTGN7]